MSFFSLNLISMVLVLLLTGFFSTQGTFSTLLTLLMAVFGSILAMGVGPALAGVMPASVNEYAQGISFLGTFVVTFVALRVASDMLLPKNVPLPKWPEKIAAGAVGFLAGMIIMGAVAVGLEMLPFGTAVLGNGSIDENGIVGGRPLVARFMTGIFYLTNGGSLGGKALASAHPDLGAEMTRKRHTVWPNTRQTLGKELLTIDGATVATKEQIEQFKIVPKDAGGRIVIIRTVIDKTKPGASLDVTQPNADTSFDIGEGSPFFDITAAQVRLVVKDQAGYRDYNPIGYLNHGGENTDLRKKQQIAFEPMDLANGMVVADYNDKDKAIIEWIFELPEKADPLFIELKRGGVRDVYVEPDKKYETLAVGKYPPMKIFAHQCDITIVVKDEAGQPKAGAMVWIVEPNVQKRLVNSMAQAAKNKLEDYQNRDSATPWPDAAAGGVPGYGEISSAYRTAVDNVINKGNDDPLQWTQVLQVLFFGQAQRDGKSMVSNLTRYFRGDFLALMNTADMRKSKLDSFVTDATGTHAATTVRPGKYVIIVAVASNDSFKMWVVEPDITAKMDKYELNLPGTTPPSYQCDTTK